MPRVELPVTDVSRDGLSPNWRPADATEGHYVALGPDVLIVIRATTNAVEPTFITYDNTDDLPIADLASGYQVGKDLSVPINGLKVYGPFPSFPYDNDMGQLEIDVDVDTGVELTAIRVGTTALRNTVV